MRNISVNAQQLWVDTGVDLKTGEALTISAKGQWTNGGNPTYFVGPDGMEGVKPLEATLNSANFASLIGKVGDQVFFVGGAYKGTSPAAGQLYLQMNDIPNAFADNSGKLDVEVKSLSFGPSTEYDTGGPNAVALDDSGNAVEVHVGTGRLFYRVGKVDFANQAIDCGSRIEYDTGGPNAVALNSISQAVEVHVGTGRLFYRVGVGSP